MCPQARVNIASADARNTGVPLSARNLVLRLRRSDDMSMLPGLTGDTAEVPRNPLASCGTRVCGSYVGNKLGTATNDTSAAPRHDVQPFVWLPRLALGRRSGPPMLNLQASTTGTSRLTRCRSFAAFLVVFGTSRKAFTAWPPPPPPRPACVLYAHACAPRL